jgi:DNA replication protein DnaC
MVDKFQNGKIHKKEEEEEMEEESHRYENKKMMMMKTIGRQKSAHFQFDKGQEEPKEQEQQVRQRKSIRSKCRFA